MELASYLLDRESELNLITDRLTRLQAGVGGVVVLCGPAGSGKTALLTTATDLALRRGLFAQVTTFTRFDRHTAVRPVDRHSGEPRVICFEDLHLADDGTVGDIIELAAELRDAPVLLLLTVRPAPGEVYLRCREHLGIRAGCQWLTLGPLTESAVSALAESSFGLVLDRRAAAEALRLCNGNLALLKAIFADCAQALGPGGRPESVAGMLGAEYRAAVLECYYGLGLSIRRIVLAAAMLGEYAGARTVAEVIGCTVEEAAAALTEIAAAGLTLEGCLRDPGAAELLRAEISPQYKAVLDRRTATALRGAGASALRVARHLITADYVDSTWTDFLLDEAIEQARSAGDRDMEISILRLALRAGRDAGERGRILMELAALFSVTDPEQCSQYLHEAGAALSLQEAWRRHSGLLTDQFVRRGRAAEALAAMNTLNAPDAAERTEADRLVVWTEEPRLIAGGDRPLAVPGDRAPHQAAYGLLQTLTSAEPPADAVRRAKDAIYGNALAEHTAPIHVLALTALLYAGELELVRSLTDCDVLNAALPRAPVWTARLTALHAEASVRLGEYRQGAVDALAALRLLPAPAWGVRLGAPVSSLLLALAAGADAGSTAVPAPPVGTLETRYGLHYLYARAQFNLFKGHLDAAVADFLSCGRLMASWGVDHEHVLPWRLAAAGAMLGLDAKEEAVNLLDERLDRLEAGPGHGRKAVREQIFHRLYDAVRERRLIEEVRLIRRGDQRDRRRAGEAASRYRIQDRYSLYLDKLSLAERQVALRAAQGESNRVIARTLSVSISTVEQHLTKVYRKLGIQGRPALRALLG